MERMNKKYADKSSSNDLNSFGGRLKDAREEAGLKGTGACKIVNSYLKAKGLDPVHIDTFRSWENIGTPKEKKKGKSYPHPAVYTMLASLYGVTGYWLFQGGMGGQVAQHRNAANNPRSTDIQIEQRKAITPESRAHQRIELKFRRLFWKSTTKQKRAIELLLDSVIGDADE